MSKKDIIEKLIAGVLLVLVGVAFLFVSRSLLRRAVSFSQDGVRVQGTVIDQERFRRNDEYRYRTFIEFKPDDGAVTEFETTELNRRLRDGYKIDVVYLPSDPAQAQVASFGRNWLWTGGVGLGSLLFVMAGIATLGSVVNGVRTKNSLRRSGEVVSAEITQIKLDPTGSSSRRRMQPYAIFAQWHDPATNKVHVFKSQSIWFDPTDHVEIGEEIEVLIDANNPKRYYVDVSSLPSLAW